MPRYAICFNKLIEGIGHGGQTRFSSGGDFKEGICLSIIGGGAIGIVILLKEIAEVEIAILLLGHRSVVAVKRLHQIRKIEFAFRVESSFGNLFQIRFFDCDFTRVFPLRGGLGCGDGDCCKEKSRENYREYTL